MKTFLKNPLYIFYLVVIYVMLQLAWWSYMIINLNGEIHGLKKELIYKNENNSNTMQQEESINKKLQKRNVMILGEGFVFFTLLILGIYQTRKSINRETALAQLQNNFLLSVTHELKTPLASMQLQLETLKFRELDREKQVNILNNALNDNQRLTRLIEDILLASKMENLSIPLHLESVDLNIELQNLLSKSIVFRAEATRVKINTPSIESLALADKDGLSSIFVNLIDNALKYSENAVELFIIHQSSNILIKIFDHGSGIADVEKEKIFFKFYRTGNEETRNNKGTGLGLYIVKKLIEAHQWKIEVKDNTPKGSIFEITIPKLT